MSSAKWRPFCLGPNVLNIHKHIKLESFQSSWCSTTTLNQAILMNAGPGTWLSPVHAVRLLPLMLWSSHGFLTDMFSVEKKHSWDVLQSSSTIMRSYDTVLNRKTLHEAFLCPMHLWFLWQCVSLFIVCVPCMHSTIPQCPCMEPAYNRVSLYIIFCASVSMHAAYLWQSVCAHTLCVPCLYCTISPTPLCHIHAAYLWWSVSLGILCVSSACTTPYPPQLHWGMVW